MSGLFSQNEVITSLDDAARRFVLYFSPERFCQEQERKDAAAAAYFKKPPRLFKSNFKEARTTFFCYRPKFWVADDKNFVSVNNPAPNRQVDVSKTAKPSKPRYKEK